MDLRIIHSKALLLMAQMALRMDLRKIPLPKAVMGPSRDLLLKVVMVRNRDPLLRVVMLRSRDPLLKEAIVQSRDLLLRVAIAHSKDLLLMEAMVLQTMEPTHPLPTTRPETQGLLLLAMALTLKHLPLEAILLPMVAPTQVLHQDPLQERTAPPQQLLHRIPQELLLLLPTSHPSLFEWTRHERALLNEEISIYHLRNQKTRPDMRLLIKMYINLSEGNFSI
jgi:hypothetical protein